MGWLARQYGLACDNVVSCTVVTAAGDVVRASADEHPDLFWGLRGGGGNFGIVVEFEFRLHSRRHPDPGRRAHVPARSRRASAAWLARPGRGGRPPSHSDRRDIRRHRHPRICVGRRPGGRPQRCCPALRSIGLPSGEVVRESSYLELQTRNDSIDGRAYRRYWKGHYLPGMPDGAIGALLDRDPADATLPGLSLQSHGGAIADVDDDATAFSHRRTRFEYVAGAKWDDPGEDGQRMAAARQEAAKLDPFAAGAYVNTLSDEGASGVRRAYPDAKRARLTEVKDAYDPDNVFHLNHNIAPTPADARAGRLLPMLRPLSHSARTAAAN